jgi:hydrogenase expression/formation protein HypC
MCLGFPGRVIELDADGAVVDTDGRRRRATTLYLPDVAVGDWVTVAAGTIVDRLEPSRAAEIQDLLRTAINRQSENRNANTKEGASNVHAS